MPSELGILRPIFEKELFDIVDQLAVHINSLGMAHKHYLEHSLFEQKRNRIEYIGLIKKLGLSSIN